jgi:hypothetical protein
MPISTAPLNPNEPMVNANRKPSQRFIEWATALLGNVDAAPARVFTVNLSAQNAAIGTTAIGTPAATGLYRVAVYQRITTAAGVSSSLTTTIAWTDGGVTCSLAGASLTGNTVTTVGTFTMLIKADGSTPVSFSTAYASNAAGAMQYTLAITLERVEA